jgi:hypothetical protein
LLDSINIDKLEVTGIEWNPDSKYPQLLVNVKSKVKEGAKFSHTDLMTMEYLDKENKALWSGVYSISVFASNPNFEMRIALDENGEKIQSVRIF